MTFSVALESTLSVTKQPSLSMSRLKRWFSFQEHLHKREPSDTTSKCLAIKLLTRLTALCALTYNVGPTQVHESKLAVPHKVTHQGRALSSPPPRRTRRRHEDVGIVAGFYARHRRLLEVFSRLCASRDCACSFAVKHQSCVF